MRDTVETLGLLQTRSRTLAATLRGILRGHAPYLDVDLRVHGRPRPLPPAAHSAIAALMAATADAVGHDPNTTTLVVRLQYDPGQFQLDVRSDAPGADV